MTLYKDPLNSLLTLCISCLLGVFIIFEQIQNGKAWNTETINVSNCYYKATVNLNMRVDSLFRPFIHVQGCVSGA